MTDRNHQRQHPRGSRFTPTAKVLIAALAIGPAVAVLLFLSAGGGMWPPPPGVRERAWRRTDTWQVRRRESPWKKPLAEDPIYQRYVNIYDRIEELDARARESGWRETREYRDYRFHLDRHYAGSRSLVYRLRSSGTENTRRGRAQIETATANLEDLVDKVSEQAKLFEQGRRRGSTP